MVFNRTGDGAEPASFIWLRRADQGCVGIVVVGSLLVIAAFYFHQRVRHGGMIDIDEQTEPRSIEFQVDINSARWPELTMLPGIGENLAKRIVASRENRGRFTDHADLQRVRGIGPRTLERIRPYLLPIPGADNIAAD